MVRLRNFENTLSRLPGAKQSGDHWTAPCPLPGHKTPAGHLNLKDAGDKALVTCQGGKHTYRDYCETWGYDSLTYSPNGKGTEAEIIATYDYTDEAGKLLYQVIRYEPKAFKQRRPDGNGGWLWNLNGVKPVIYQLPEVIAAVREVRIIYIPEGEKDADALRKIELTATTNSGGAGKWRSEYSEVLKGTPVVIIADKDAPGREHAAKVAASLHGKANPIKIVELPDRDGYQIKDVSDWLSAGGTVAELEGLTAKAPEYKPTPEEELGGLLADVERFISLYVSTGEAERTALALWVAHTHAIEAAECTPYLYVTSPEKQSGKTRLLEVLALLVARPWFTARVSAAVLVRKVSRDAPTLLLDETDSAFKADKEYSEALRGLLNAGYRRGGVASLCVKKGGDFDLVDFPVFCAKVLSGIGQLPDTIADRSIRINMKRRSPDEPVERFRLRAAQAQASPLRGRLEQWANIAVTRLADARPVLPEELSDRAADVWEPLFAGADMAGGEWPRWSRQAAGVLSSHADDDGLSWGAQLLRDIALVLDGREGPISSGELVAALVEREESPWGDLRGRPLDARKLARMLKPYGIRPHTVRLGNATPKGYQAEDFGDAFNRYISGIAATTATQNTPKANSVPGLVADVADKRGIRADGDTPLPAERREAALGMPVSEALKIWTAEGKPVMHLGDGENCEDLAKLLSNPGVSERHLKTIRAWLEKQGGEQC
ncbi:DUF3631 domain-containing protein [Chloroflexota bacterium]